MPLSILSLLDTVPSRLPTSYPLHPLPLWTDTRISRSLASEPGLVGCPGEGTDNAATLIEAECRHRGLPRPQKGLDLMYVKLTPSGHIEYNSGYVGPKLLLGVTGC